MKKYFAYIFIIITLAILLGPISSTEAQTDGQGSCGRKDKLGQSSGLHLPSIDACRSWSSGDDIISATWQEDGSTSVTIIKEDKKLGSCNQTDNLGQNLVTDDVSSAECISLSNSDSIVSANWKQYGYILPVYFIVKTAPSTTSPRTPENSSVPSAQRNRTPGIESEGSYVLLEPLPCKEGMPGCSEAGQITSIDPSGAGKLGMYLNLMINLFIGLCAVAAVVMITIGGIEYSTAELVSNKAAAKERIQNALLGLLLALCSWLILNTINPDLLITDTEIGGVDLGIDYEDVEIIEGTAAVPYSGPIPAGRSGACAVGVERTRSGLVACKDIAQNVQNMMEAARAAGINLSGGGYRTYEQQIQTRRNNCGTSDYQIYHMPADQCRPPTARPGRSMHESGRAFDLNCNGVLIRTRNNACFVWLQANASRFGLYNLPSEPWHWSVNGR